MPEWLLPILSAAKDPDMRGWLLTLVLIVVVDRRLARLATAVESLIVYVTQTQAHQTSRMQEIRNALYNMVGWPIPDDERVPTPRSRGKHAATRSIQKPTDGPVC